MIELESHSCDKIEYLYNQNDINLVSQKHTHRSFELALVLEGCLVCELDSRSIELHKNQALLVLPGQIHSYRIDEYCESSLCVFSSDWVSDFHMEMKGKCFENPVFSLEGERVRELLQDKGSSRYQIKAVLYDICSRLYSSSPVNRLNEADFLLANSLAFYIQSNYRQKIDLKTMAKDMGYSYCYLSSFFNRTFSVGFSAYVNSYRTEAAKDYLRHTTMDISEISALCGFETVRNFNRIFKSLTGKTPRQYRGIISG